MSTASVLLPQELYICCGRHYCRRARARKWMVPQRVHGAAPATLPSCIVIAPSNPNPSVVWPR